MVKQKQTVKTSSKRRRSGYVFPCRIYSNAPLPKTLEVKPDSSKPVAPDFPNYVITGTLHEDVESGVSNEESWREPPHLAFANLRINDPQSVTAFIRRYGVLCALFQTNEERTKFEIPSWDLKISQGVLQDAWKGDSESILHIEQVVEENINAPLMPDGGCVLLMVRDLWQFAAFLFLMDYKAERVGVCENPDCPAPYFVKKRRTQKFCEAGTCTNYAHRQYALKWWNAEGKSRRERHTKGKKI